MKNLLLDTWKEDNTDCLTHKNEKDWNRGKYQIQLLSWS